MAGALTCLYKQQPGKAILLWHHNYIPIKQWDVLKYLQPTFPFLSVYFCFELPFYANQAISNQ